ncbi:hypothetical protein [Spirosoma endophyticum]|uniref:Uncharacterized protein n=1 Tax=Spirosoma endophyticum TaxID=662367 RepID=A0A1I2H349_9BACT|nr:hypothetical protein [Spirosoma endophyticum]SFF24565.1 hypothetical protein SAMN05216167_1383 [Spirosoma endophyticum]
MIHPVVLQQWKTDVGLATACANIITAQQELSRLALTLASSTRAASQLARLIAPPIVPLQLANLGLPRMPVGSLLEIHWHNLAGQIERPVLLTSRLQYLTAGSQKKR